MLSIRDSFHLLLCTYSSWFPYTTTRLHLFRGLALEQLVDGLPNGTSFHFETKGLFEITRLYWYTQTFRSFLNPRSQNFFYTCSFRKNQLIEIGRNFLQKSSQEFKNCKVTKPQLLCSRPHFLVSHVDSSPKPSSLETQSSSILFDTNNSQIDYLWFHALSKFRSSWNESSHNRMFLRKLDDSQCGFTTQGLNWALLASQWCSDEVQGNKDVPRV